MTELEAQIAGLSTASSDADVFGVIRAAASGLPEAAQEKAFDRIRRNTHMNRGSFKRLLKHATARANA
jgi:hypothetical protein